MESSLISLVTVIIFILSTVVMSTKNDAVSNFEKIQTTDISDFFQLVVNDVFIDKSLFIEACVKEFGLADRFLRPDGWGKTTNLDMLRRFLELELDDDGKPIAEDKKIHRKFFVGGKIVISGGLVKELKPLRISQSKEAMAVQGQYPVIAVSFANVTGSTYAEVMKCLGELITDLFRKRAYLRNNCSQNRTKEDEVGLFDAYSSGPLNRTMLTGGFNFLCELLHRRFGKKPYVLIDDYDRPLNDVFLKELQKIRRTKEQFKAASEKHMFYYAGMSDEVQDTLTLLQELLEQKVKVNEHVKYVFMTGLYEFQLIEFTYGIHDHTTYNLMNPKKYFKFFGFSDDDIDWLLSSNRLSIKPNRTKLYEWYGYNITGGVAYNSRSVRRFLANGGVFDDYWTRNNGTDRYDVVNMFRKDRRRDDNDIVEDSTVADEVLSSDFMQQNVQQLFEGRTVTMGLRRRVEFTNVIRDASALAPAGYLNVQPYSTRALVNFTAANREVRSILKAKMIKWTCRKLNATVSDFRQMADYLLAFEAEQFETALRRLVSAFPKYVFPWDAEVCYDGLMKSLLYSFSGEYRRQSGRNSIAILGIPEISSMAILVAYQAVEEPEHLQKEVERRRNGTTSNNPNNNNNNGKGLLPEFDAKLYPHIDQLFRLNITFCKKSFHMIYDIRRRLQQEKTTSAWVL